METRLEKLGLEIWSHPNQASMKLFLKKNMILVICICLHGQDMLEENWLHDVTR